MAEPTAAHWGARALLALRLLVSGSLLRGLQLLHGLFQAAHGGFERDDLGIGRVELLEGLERVLGHEPLQEVDVALQAARPLVEPRGLRAILYARDILRLRGSGRDHDQAQAQHRQSDHLLSPSRSFRSDGTPPCPTDDLDRTEPHSAGAFGHDATCGPATPFVPVSL